MSNINDNLIDTINSQILHGNRTLNLISQSYNLLNSQQQNIYLLTRLLQSNLNNSNNNNNNNNNSINTNNDNNISRSNPFSIIINDISVSDISSSNIELNSLLYSSLMNLLSDTSLNITNDLNALPLVVWHQLQLQLTFQVGSPLILKVIFSHLQRPLYFSIVPSLIL